MWKDPIDIEILFLIEACYPLIKDGLYAGYCGAIPIPIPGFWYWYSIGVSQKSSIPNTRSIPKFKGKQQSETKKYHTKYIANNICLVNNGKNKTYVIYSTFHTFLPYEWKLIT